MTACPPLRMSFLVFAWLIELRFAQYRRSQSKKAKVTFSNDHTCTTARRFRCRPASDKETVAIHPFEGAATLEVFHESSRDQYRRRRRAVQRHGCAGISDPHKQSRRRSQRPRVGRKRAVCPQPLPGARQL